MSQISNILYLNLLKKAGISSFLQDKPNYFYKQNKLKNITTQKNIKEIKNLKDLEIFIKKSKDSKFYKYPKTLVEEGDIKEKIFIIGDFPVEEDNKIKFFSSKCDELLNKMLNAINLNKNNVYIATVFPWVINESKINNKAILDNLPFIQRQIEIINPKIILLIGNISAKAILNTNLEITKLRGKWHQYQSVNLNKSIECLVTYHPRDLIKFPKEKKYAWSDLQIFQKKVYSEN